MRINRTWLLAVIAITVLAALLFSLRRHSGGPGKEERRVTEAEPPASGTTKPGTAALGTSAPQQVQRTTPTATNPGPPTPAAALSATRLEQAIAERNAAVNFYGKVVDQNGNPIPSVRIVMSVRHGALSPSQAVIVTYPKKEFLTDSEGRFQWTGETGDSLTMETVIKDGYRLAPSAPQNYGPSSGTVENPTIIKMWKLGQPAKLVGVRSLFGFVPDGRPYTLDLVADKKQQGRSQQGDIVVQITRPPDVKSRDKFEWTLDVQALGGGLIGEMDDFPYLAPESGYEAAVTIHMLPTNPAWTSVLKTNFYFTSRNGQVFGAIGMTVRPVYNDRSSIFIESSANPNSSRNLQP